MPMKNLRPPAVPLVTVDPFFNVWSMTDNLYGEKTKHWTSKDNSMTGMIMIDGKPYVFMGQVEGCCAIEQTGVQVSPMSSIYHFESEAITLEVRFTTPLFMDDLDVLSRPVSYVTFNVVSKDEKVHDVKIYFDASAEWCVDTPDRKVNWGRSDFGKGIQAMYMGNEKQVVLSDAGDNRRIDWGYFYVVVPNGDVQTVIQPSSIQKNFIENGTVPTEDDTQMPKVVEEETPTMACVLDLPKVADKVVSAYLVLAYDDIYSVEYFEKPLVAYWRRDGVGFADMVIKAVSEYCDIMKKCDTFDSTLIEDAMCVGGKNYADLLSLGYRQAIAAHKLVADEEGNPLFFSKENFSNGCMGTVDVSYPSIPLFLLYNADLVKGMMIPIFKYADMDAWPYEFAPHDVGRYPKANGQVYSTNKETDELEYERQMPVEECGNMLIMAAAVCKADNSVEFAERYWHLLTKWVIYLINHGMDPGNQLCTDDFAGHLAHNTNLSIKAILGIAGYSILCSMRGMHKQAEEYLKTAKEMAKQWEEMSRDGDHYKLTFDQSGTWSQKYNLVWDELFDLNIFPHEIADREISYYLRMQNQYGLPLDSREDYTKSDWIMWTAAMAKSKEEFIQFIQPMWDFLNETECRAPFTDWYNTVTGKQTRCMCHEGRRGFRNRSVIGGIFIKMLKEKWKWRG